MARFTPAVYILVLFSSSGVLGFQHLIGMRAQSLHALKKTPDKLRPCSIFLLGNIREAADTEASDRTQTISPIQAPPTSAITPLVDGDPSDSAIWIGRLTLLGIAALWGTNFPVVKYLETLCFHPPCNHPPSEATFARFGVASAVAFPILAKQWWDGHIAKSVASGDSKSEIADNFFPIILAGLECGLYISLGYFSQALALESVGSTEVAFLCSLTVVVVPFLSVLFMGKKVKAINLFSAFLAVLGVGILEGVINVNDLFDGLLLEKVNALHFDAGLGAVGGQGGTMNGVRAIDTVTAITANSAVESKSIFFGMTKGDLLALGQPIGFGTSFIRIEQAMSRFSHVKGSALTLAMAQCIAVGGLSLAWLLYDFHGIPNMGYLLEPHRVGAILWTSVVTTVFAVWLQGVALKSVSAVEAALTFSTEPVWATLFAALFLGESVGTKSYIGGFVILAACGLSVFADFSKKKSTTEN